MLGYRNVLYFHKYKLAMEVDEFNHWDSNIAYKIKRKKAIENELECTFIKINPDEKNFNIFKSITKIH